MDRNLFCVCVWVSLTDVDPLRTKPFAVCAAETPGRVVLLLRSCFVANQESTSAAPGSEQGKDGVILLQWI